MDAGLAAVLGALAGSVATIGAALATGWSQREGARIAARAEHRRQRREPRHDVYKAFISEASRMRDHVSILEANDQLPTGLITAELASRCELSAEAVREKWLEVALAGPQKMAETASRIERTSNVLAARVRGLVGQRYGISGNPYQPSTINDVVREEARKVKDALEIFILDAQSALDDDGSFR